MLWIFYTFYLSILSHSAFFYFQRHLQSSKLVGEIYAPISYRTCASSISAFMLAAFKQHWHWRGADIVGRRRCFTSPQSLLPCPDYSLSAPACYARCHWCTVVPTYIVVEAFSLLATPLGWSFLIARRAVKVYIPMCVCVCVSINLYAFCYTNPSTHISLGWCLCTTLLLLFIAFFASIHAFNLN